MPDRFEIAFVSYFWLFAFIYFRTRSKRLADASDA
jgi:hypothetical protein